MNIPTIQPPNFSVSVKEDQDKLPPLYWLPKPQKTIQSTIYCKSSSCTTTELSKWWTSGLTAIRKHVI